MTNPTNAEIKDSVDALVEESQANPSNADLLGALGYCARLCRNVCKVSLRYADPWMAKQLP